MTQIINLNDFRCNDCKFFDDNCKIFGLDKPKTCKHFTLKDEHGLNDCEADYV